MKYPSDLASTHPPLARKTTQRLSTMMIDSSCCVIRVQYLAVLRSSKTLLKFREIFSSLSNGRWSRHSSGAVMRTFCYSRKLVCAVRSTRRLCASSEASRIFSFGQPWFSVGFGQCSTFPQHRVEQYLAEVLRVAGAVRSQVLFSLDSIRIEQRRRRISFLVRILSISTSHYRLFERTIRRVVMM